MIIKNASFVISNSDITKCPSDGKPEYAFIGRSNVGKSSLINMLTGKKKLAKTSGTPGKTQLINHFLINDEWYLVDLPGYGYAKAGKKDIESWQKTSFEYLAKRPNLKRVFLLLDPIKGVKESDKDIANMFNTLGVSFQIVLTKVDKLKEHEIKKTEDTLAEISKTWPALYPGIIRTSSVHKIGIHDLQNAIVEILKFL